MKVQDYINNLSKLNPDEFIVAEHITETDIINLAKERFNADIDKFEAVDIIRMLANGIRESQLEFSACNDISDFLDNKFPDDRDDNNDYPYEGK